jgi:hypothetical protein
MENPRGIEKESHEEHKHVRAHDQPLMHKLIPHMNPIDTPKRDNWHFT